MRVASCLTLLLLGTAAAAAPVKYQLVPETTTLIRAAGVELAQSTCGTCHSFDYITTQPRQRGAAFWQGVINKMIKTYGAPIAQQDAAPISAYLSKNY
jgi:mono/diheme cytochrome c family protein